MQASAMQHIKECWADNQQGSTLDSLSSWTSRHRLAATSVLPNKRCVYIIFLYFMFGSDLK